MSTPERVETTGTALIAECDLKMVGCKAVKLGPVTMVFVGATQDQFNVCQACLAKMIREGEWMVPHSKIQAVSDFLLVDDKDRAVVAVDVRGMPRSTALDLRTWASSLRRNLAVHGALPHAAYFMLLALPDKGFLWSPEREGVDRPLADYEFDLGDELAEVAASVGAGHFDSEAEARVASWLSLLVARTRHPKGLWWTESGLERIVKSVDLKVVRPEPPGYRAAI